MTTSRDRRERTLFERLLWRKDPELDGAGFTRPTEQREAFLINLEGANFNWLVYCVAASGFFTDSYNLFASNVILPALAFVYWNGEGHVKEIAFNLATLTGSAVGQAIFGLLADIYGRRALYGVELIIVIISTIGLLQCSAGIYDPTTERHTWNFTAWLLFWRTIMGFGIGAEYPLSACIAAEWSSTKSRGRMLSAVFLMQPLGQLCAYAVGLIVLCAFKSYTLVDIDRFWRYVVGIGAIPTVIALIFRITIPEAGRYTYDVRKNPKQADKDTAKVYTDSTSSVNRISQVPASSTIVHNQFCFKELHDYLVRDTNWILLFGTSACWLLLDFVFFGLGFNNPSTLAKIWSPRDLLFPKGTPRWLKTSPLASNGTIHDVLQTNMLHAVYTVSIASIVGSILMIILINRVDRKDMLTITFLCLAALLLIIFASFTELFHREGKHIVLVAFWTAISFIFSFGPNTLTFIIPAEVFPTKYRCTFYGIAAASGKIGAILVQCVVLSFPSISSDPNSPSIRWLLLAFSLCMLLGAGISWLCIPYVQFRSAKPPPPFENIPLEDLASGRGQPIVDAEMAKPGDLYV